MSFDPALFKQHFPLFAQEENRELLYLDNAATTQKPQAVIEAISHFYLHANGNAHRSSHRLGRAATEVMEQCREKAAHFLGAQAPSEIIFTRGATEALNLLAFSLCQNLAPGDEIILSAMEHHANLVPWQLAAQRRQLTLKFLNGNRPQDLQQLPGLLSDKTRIISLSAASNALGCRLDSALLNELRGTHPALVVLDAAQLAAHQVIDVTTLGCDFLVCSAHKFYGPTGIGLLWGKKHHLDDLPPWQGGGEMIEQVELSHSRFAPVPHRFEAGTSSLAAIAGLSACLDFWASQDRAAMARHEASLCRLLHSRLQTLPQLKLFTNSDNNVGIATLVPAAGQHWHSSDLAHWLDQHDIAVRAGHHCTQPLMKQLGTDHSLRISLGAYNSREDIERCIEVVKNFPAFHEQAPEIHTGSVFGDDLSALNLDELLQQGGWQQRYKTLQLWARHISHKAWLRNEETRVRGCESPAWLSHTEEQGRHYFAIDSDARVVKGLAALLLVLIDGKHSADISREHLQAVFAQLGLEKHLSPSRSNGFKALMEAALGKVGN